MIVARRSQAQVRCPSESQYTLRPPSECPVEREVGSCRWARARPVVWRRARWPDAWERVAAFTFAGSHSR